MDIFSSLFLCWLLVLNNFMLLFADFPRRWKRSLGYALKEPSWRTKWRFCKKKGKNPIIVVVFVLKGLT